MTTRRSFLQTSLTAAVLSSFPELFSAERSATGAPLRFIFMHRGNGLFPEALVPPSFSADQKQQDQQKQPLDIDLAGHELPDWMAPLASHQQDLTLLQGLSGKMCTVGHHSWCSSLGVFKANERVSSIRWATVDFELAKLFPSPLQHIELAVFPLDGGNPRGSLDGIAQGFSARGPQQPNYAFGSPAGALRELFKSVSDNPADQTAYQLEREILAFVAGNEGRRAAGLHGIERRKIAEYAESVEAVQSRNARVDRMADILRQHIPQLDPKYLADEMSTLDRQRGHTEVLLAALTSGLTNVAAFTVDELGHHYTGVPGLEGEKINMHDVGHGKVIGGVEATEIRRRCRLHHMSLIDTIVTRLKGIREGQGTMFDNTMVCYFPDGGETHHSHGTEYPFVVLSGSNVPLSIRGRYLRLPGYGQQGHRTLGNWYTTILNACGNSIEHYGVLDSGLNRFGINQRGNIPEFLS